MPVSIRIWLEVAYHPAFRIGGWAFVRLDAGGVSGAAGGARQVDVERTCLAGLAAALRDPPPSASIELLSSSPEALAIAHRIAAAESGENSPTDNLDLWTSVATILRRRDWAVRRAECAPRSPTAFAAAWADLARDRAKAKGAFQSPIPKPNLVKAGL
jgi:hypothetical protein